MPSSFPNPVENVQELINSKSYNFTHGNSYVEFPVNE